MTLTHSSVFTPQFWPWQGFSLPYYVHDAAVLEEPSPDPSIPSQKPGAPLVLIHGFGASKDHWRKTLGDLGAPYRVYAIDLLGFGGAPKPTPGQPLPYSFETWARQVLDFCQEVIGEPAFLVGNSIGCVVALQAAVMDPQQVRGLLLLNCSLRMLHDEKRSSLPWYRQVTAPLLQSILGWPPLGHFFFRQLATPKTVRRVLEQAYGRREAVTDTLVKDLLTPATDPGAADVFLAFIQYSQGPLPETLLPQVSCPVVFLWGEVDPWEPVALGQALSQLGPTVQGFIPLPGVGHCPQDEAPELVNPLLRDWVDRWCTPE